MPTTTMLTVTHQMDKHHLTSRQRQVAIGVLMGHTDQEIADALGITCGTVTRHCQNLYARLGCEIGTGSTSHARLETMRRLLDVDDDLAAEWEWVATQAGR